MKRQIYLFRDVLPDEEEEEFIVKLAGIMTAKVVKGSISLPEEVQPVKKKKRKVRVRKTFPKKDKTAEGVVLKTPVEIKKTEDDYDYPMLEIF